MVFVFDWLYILLKDEAIIGHEDLILFFYPFS